MSGQFGFGSAGSSPPPEIRGPDLCVYGGGTVYVLHPASPAGHAWIDDHISAEAPRPGVGVVVEHPFIGDIVLGAFLDGLEVR